jgi:hypothetical protein
MYGRLERDEIEAPRLEDLWAIGAVLGLDLRLNAFPGGEPLADRVQVRLLAAIRTRIHPAIGWRTEVPLPIQGDRRAWDAVALTRDGWTGFEAISRLGAIDATVRRANLKQRDDPRIGRVILVLADTVRNHEAMRLGSAVLRADYPLETRTVLASLAAGTAPPLNGVVVLRVPSIDRTANPQSVHIGGKLVDGHAPEGPNLVDNPVGAGRPAP